MSVIEYYFEDIDEFSLDKDKQIECVNYLIVREKHTPGAINFIFCSDDYLLDINKQYLSHDYYTDIITFDYVEDKVVSGDLFISIDRIKENALSLNKSFINELYRVVFHGVLHLVGYKDKTDEEQAVMTQMEDFYLSKVDL